MAFSFSQTPIRLPEGFTNLFRPLEKFLERQRDASESAALEAELPVVLQRLSTELGAHASFEKAVTSVARERHAHWSPVLLRALALVEKGYGWPSALRAIGKNKSLAVRRAIAALVFAYEHGEGAESLSRLADEATRDAAAKAKAFASKLQFFGLVFIATSTLVPALFAAYTLIGSTFLESTVDVPTVWFVFLFGFPLLNAGVLYYVQKQTPAALKARQVSTRPWQLHPKFWTKKQWALFGAGLLAAIAASWFISDPILLAVFALLAVLAPLALYFGFQDFAVERRASQIDAALPASLYHFASFSSQASFEEMLERVAADSPPELKGVYQRVLRRVKSGQSVPSALRVESKQNQSPLLSRSFELLASGYESGAPFQTTLRKTADAAMQSENDTRDAAAALLAQKYTLLLGGGLLVPLVLGFLISLVGQLNATFSETMLDSLTPAAIAAKQELALAVIGATTAYLAIFTILSSGFCAVQEGTPKKAVLYAALLTPLGLAAFFAARALHVL